MDVVAKLIHGSSNEPMQLRISNSDFGGPIRRPSMTIRAEPSSTAEIVREEMPQRSGGVAAEDRQAAVTSTRSARSSQTQPLVVRTTDDPGRWVKHASGVNVGVGRIVGEQIVDENIAHHRCTEQNHIA